MSRCALPTKRLTWALAATVLAGVNLARPAAGQVKPPAVQEPARRAPAATRAARPLLEIQVTDAQGGPVEGVRVHVTGTVEREGETDGEGGVRFSNMRAGNYRLRFDREGFVSLERDVTLASGARQPTIDIVLSAARPAAPPPPPPPPPSPKVEPERPVGEPRTLQVPAFAESNFIGRGEPQKLSVVGCTGYQTTRILQVREPLPDRVNADADETLYVVAGDAMLRLAGSDRQLDPGALAVIPRGTSHTLTRRGRNPVVLVSVLSGPACKGQ